jgi:hypothetical protein
MTRSTASVHSVSPTRTLPPLTRPSIWPAGGGVGRRGGGAQHAMHVMCTSEA